jgi:fermentation-respiration switch protein FrsA (DUF1100 family)
MELRTFRDRFILRGPWRRLRRALALSALLWLLLAACAWFFAERLLFLPPAPSYRDSAEILKIPVSGGERISALHLAGPAADFTLLLSHGNAEDLGDLRGLCERYRERGFSILAYDYRGYGTSSGRPSEEAACADIETLYDHLRLELRVPPDRIILHGRSLGGGPSVALAARRPVAGLILESTFTSVFRVATEIPLFPFDKFDNLGRIGAVACPILVVHGTDDQVVPFRHGEELFRRAREPKRMLAVAGADHNNLHRIAGEAYWLALDRFRLLLAGRGRREPPRPLP